MWGHAAHRELDSNPGSLAPVAGMTQSRKSRILLKMVNHKISGVSEEGNTYFSKILVFIIGRL